MISNDDFNNISNNLLKEESFDIPNNDYVTDFYRLVDYVNGLSYDDDPIANWVYEPLTGEPSNNTDNEEQIGAENDLETLIDKFSHTNNATDVNTLIDEYAERAGYKTIDV